jgi:RNA polymerase sigma-70 factor (ECF subfamily)
MWGQTVADVASASSSSGDSGPSSDAVSSSERSKDSSDARLVERVADGDSSALAELYDRHGQRAYSLARRICREQSLADDVVRDSFVSLWRDPQLFDPERGGFTGWLMSQLHDKAVGSVRIAGRRDTRSAEGFDDDRSELSSAEPEVDQIRNEVRQALERLSAEQRRALALTYYGGYTQQETAAIMKASLATTQSRMFESVQKLRRLLVPRLWNSPNVRPSAMSGAPQCPKAQLAVGWALHALEPEDESVIVEHLPSCHICREAVQQTEELVGLLAASGPTVAPVAELRDRILEEVAATEQTPKDRRDKPWLQPSGVPEGRGITVGWHQGSGSDRGMAAMAAERLAAQRKAARRRRFRLLLITVVIAVLGVGALIYQQLQLAKQGQHVEASRPGQLNQIVNQVRAPGVRFAVLNTPGGDPVAGLQISGTLRQVLPYALKPNTPSTGRYVLWGIDGARPVPIAWFDVTASNRSLRPVGPPVPPDETYRVYVISIEAGPQFPPAPSLIVASGQVAS